MAARAELAEQWNAVAQTKFRAPRLRRDAVARPALFERLVDSIDHNPITLVCAPGGCGKTTLLAQLCAGPVRNFHVLWVSVDDDDDDANRFFAALLQSIQPLGLQWEVDPRSLLTSVAASKAHTRAALAAMVNALCTTSAPRIVLVLDDLHRIHKPEPFELLDSLIERLPDHVAVVLGSRIEPPLSLARWRAYGELGAFTSDDLQFTVDEATELGTRRLGRTPDPDAIREAVKRTHGWVAGLMLLLQSRSGLAASAAEGDDAEADRRLFEYLAQEVLQELPDDLQDFILRSSILLQLNPTMCRVLTDRVDARLVLEDLYRRNLFLTALDETTPVLRFHDLFRDFLESELARRDPALKRTLHVRAAHAETIDSRAIYHLLNAERWDEAITRIAAAGEDRLVHGGIATVERWIDAIPSSLRANDPALAYLHGMCAWFHWNWPVARRELAIAVEGLVRPEEASRRARALFQLVDALNSSGAREEARVRVEQAAEAPLDALGKAELALQRAWCAAPEGDPARVAEHLREYIERVEADPATMCPATADRIHVALIGIPGVADVFERFYTCFLQTRGGAPLPWHISALTVGAWAHLWRGRRAEMVEVLTQAEALQHQFGATRLLIERLGQIRSLWSMLNGQAATSIAIMRRHTQGMQDSQMQGHNLVWLRAYRQALGRAFWMTQDAGGFREIVQHVTAPPLPGEWPFAETAAAVFQGIDAMFDKDWRRAEMWMREALRTHASRRMPMMYLDPRINLGYALLMQGRKADAWAAFEPYYREVIDERAVGLLLIESHQVVDQMLELTPPNQRQTAEHAAMLETWRRWNEAAPADERPARGGALAGLSERELEVLAEVSAGASNKHIARELSLSLHTVKRHIANILDKLDCDSRGQAADLFRRLQTA